ncbi:hypothetical protein M427DRAFT_210845 [Gonapodya prolifera JEL478]|uniref:Uncharacterized protein n=1 Tax=Gonapodya prolifera (strain JEL478) TaxID=1344416 RepID=A0A139ANX4_GONPJ|nr:hypothetical protein M427DRAFT_210845 [Gonapodya prolifera JEL478]|eukprot:KXS18449.1 hypothetical protein M427DRAFT_210845 [Gonapodya prolifera JEL478]
MIGCPVTDSTVAKIQGVRSVSVRKPSNSPPIKHICFLICIVIKFTPMIPLCPPHPLLLRERFRRASSTLCVSILQFICIHLLFFSTRVELLPNFRRPHQTSWRPGFAARATSLFVLSTPRKRCHRM